MELDQDFVMGTKKFGVWGKNHEMMDIFVNLADIFKKFEFNSL